ncbi:MAG: type II toxin-antitoxin system RelE/ParE family toxin [Pseudomonadota bacterium]
MPGYRLTNAAKDDLRRIYLRGIQDFGEAKADAYFYALIRRFEEIAESPLQYPAIDVIRTGYRRSLVGQDSIYYWIDGETVEITAVLGRQDHERWLKGG